VKGQEKRELGDTERGALVKIGRHGNRTSGFETKNHWVLTLRGRGEAELFFLTGLEFRGSIESRAGSCFIIPAWTPTAPKIII